jgi:hypothetical protein
MTFEDWWKRNCPFPEHASKRYEQDAWDAAKLGKETFEEWAARHRPFPPYAPEGGCRRAWDASTAAGGEE